MFLGLETKVFENEDKKKAGDIDTLDTLDRDAILDVLEGQSGDKIPECRDGDCGCGETSRRYVDTTTLRMGRQLDAGIQRRNLMSEYNSDSMDERQLPSSGSGGKNTAKMHNTGPHAIAEKGRREPPDRRGNTKKIAAATGGKNTAKIPNTDPAYNC